MSIINCRQLVSVCQASVIPKFADKSGAAVTRTVTGITKTEKCSWNASATLDAPTFLITTPSNLLPVDGSGYFIHYVEYGTQVQKTPTGSYVNVSFDTHNPSSSNPWISYLSTDVLGGTNNDV